MANHNEPTLRNALDAVNRSRKWALVGVTSLVFVIVIALVLFAAMVFIPATQQGVAIDAPSGEPSVAVNRLVPMSVLWLSLAAQLFFVACGAGIVILHVSRMTRVILRAIDTLKE